MKNQIRRTLAAAVGILGILSLGACTKSIPYKLSPYDEKESVIRKSLIDQEAEYLYSASMQNASRSSADALPFSSGDNKRVKIQITKNTLRIVETERDQRFAPNAANTKLVLEIPIEHVDYKCAKDRYGECKNEEEDSKDLPWDQRPDIRVSKLEEAKSGELDLLPIMISQTLGENCYDSVSARLVSSSLQSDAINFQIERTFKTRIECLGNVETLSDAIVTATFHYSLVKLDTVLSKDFKPVSYPEGSMDEQTFGFFASKRVKLDVDNNNTNQSTLQILNHWNPNRTEIVYHLSQEFAKPENKQIRDLTYQTVENLNQGLTEAGVKFRVRLQDPSGKVPGDIRNTMIVLVEDPVASSIIGYGPQTEDPVTGEIIAARTVMFLGTIKKFIKSKYEEVRRANAELATNSGGSTGSSKAGGSGSLRQLPASAAMNQRLDFVKNSPRLFNAEKLTAKINQRIKQGGKHATDAKLKSSLASEKISQIKKSVFNYTAVSNPLLSGKDLKSQLRYQHHSKNCAFEPNLDVTSSGISSKLTAEFPAGSKPWDQLTETEKNRVIEILLPQVWVPTLIHELGHNLGLRHNFAASEDKANFLSFEELKSKNIDHAIPFSSVMDYGDDLKALPYLGKYDIAALKFAYLRTVELNIKDPKDPLKVIGTEVKSIATNLEAMKKATEGLAVKDFKFCTDEHVGINAGCKRHDLGTTYTEIVQNQINDYEAAYARRNFRNGNAHMSLADDMTYARRIHGIFNELRLMMEVRERIKYQYGLADTATEWTSEEFLKDLHQATVIGGTFLTKVLLTPDVLCAIELTAKPGEVDQVVPLEALSSTAMSCFSVKLKPEYVVVGQAGKFFNSRKDPESTNNYADQIDARGIWIDKVLASHLLFSRSTGVFNLDKHKDNFMDITELRLPMIQALQGLMKNNVIDNVPFTLADGSKAALRLRYDQFDSQMIAQPLYPRFAKTFGLPTDRSVQLQEVLASGFAKGMDDESGMHEEDRALGLSFRVNRFALAHSGIDPTAKQFVVANTRFVADETNTLAISIIEEIALAQVLEKVTNEKLTEIYAAKVVGTAMPVTATADEQKIWSLPTEQIQLFLGGLLKTSAYSIKLLGLLPFR